jgi:ribose transport system ATP-binding protein
MTAFVEERRESPGGSLTDPPLLGIVGISKTYPGVTALENVDFELLPGEVHCLVGENGAGKSTLVKILGGAEPADEGHISVDGERLSLRTPADALRAGIGVIYQDFRLVPYLSVAENVSLGRLAEKGRLPIVDWPAVRERAGRLLETLGETTPLNRKVADLSPAQQQMVEIARLTERGVGVIYISHRLQEVYDIGDRVTVLRDGRYVGTFRTSELERPALVHHMVGREIRDGDSLGATTVGETILRVDHLRREPAVRDVTFEVRCGEIFSIAGLVGSGRTEAVRLVFGADRKRGGRIQLFGDEIDPRSPREAIDLGIGLLTEDRNEQGLIMELSVRDNIVLSSFKALRSILKIDWKRADQVGRNYVERLRIKTPGLHQKVMHLSGGNRQKVVLARWLFTDARLMIFDEPTKGIDVAVKSEIHGLLRDLADRGIGVVVISSDLPEALALGDRVGVMREGRMIGILDRGEATQESVMRLATGTDTEEGDGK